MDFVCFNDWPQVPMDVECFSTFECCLVEVSDISSLMSKTVS